MQRVKEGDSEAFRQLVERYNGEIYNYFIRSTGSVEDSEDLTQQCFVNLYNSLDRYKRKASIRTFLYRIATFYSSFSLKPRGKHMVNICLGTACFVKGSGQLLEILDRHLKVEVGGTTELRNWVLSFGAGARVLEPESLGADVASELERRWNDKLEEILQSSLGDAEKLDKLKGEIGSEPEEDKKDG